MKRLFRSFMHALKGVFFTFRSERNFQVELTIAGVVFLFMLWLPLSRIEESVLIIAVTLVLVLELINTATERIMDILKPRVHPYARVVKDVMAGAVLVAAFGAIILGCLIFLPYLF
jgi:diacylglycerol kinase